MSLRNALIGLLGLSTVACSSMVNDLREYYYPTPMQVSCTDSAAFNQQECKNWLSNQGVNVNNDLLVQPVKKNSLAIKTLGPDTYTASDGKTEGLCFFVRNDPDSNLNSFRGYDQIVGNYFKHLEPKTPNSTSYAVRKASQRSLHCFNKECYSFHACIPLTGDAYSLDHVYPELAQKVVRDIR